MKTDKLQHVVIGVFGLACAAFAGFILLNFGFGWFFALSTTMIGIGYEVNQYVRKEGCVDVFDAIATASPGWIALIVMEFM
jgi:hypothetical protein